jgi:hypothetical protein
MQDVLSKTKRIGREVMRFASSVHPAWIAYATTMHIACLGIVSIKIRITA